MDLGLRERVAIVTGGSRGIGQAIAAALRDEGACVAISARDERALEGAAEALRTPGARILPVVADARDRAAIERMVDLVVTTFGRVDILVNNAATAGGSARGPLAEIEDGELLADLDTKLVGYLRGIRATAPDMALRRWGRIVNIGGLSGRRAGNYGGATNLALAHLTRTAALELGPSGITVNLVHPGNVRSPLNAELRARASGGRDVDPDEVLHGNALQRPVRLEEIASLVTYLASVPAGGITGETIGISGGKGEGIVA